MADETQPSSAYQRWADKHVPVPDPAAQSGDPSLRHLDSGPGAALSPLEQIARDVGVIKAILVAAAVVWVIGFVAMFLALQSQGS